MRSPHRHSKMSIIMKMNVCKVTCCSLSDGESMINVISLLNPKQTIIINGDEKENFVMEVINEKFFMFCIYTFFRKC